jgi:hypothetical protein
MTDRTEEWKAAQRQAVKEPQVRNERNETLSQCEKRLIAEYGVDAEMYAFKHLQQYADRKGYEHLEVFYRVIVRLVKIDNRPEIG